MFVGDYNEKTMLVSLCNHNASPCLYSFQLLPVGSALGPAREGRGTGEEREIYAAQLRVRAWTLCGSANRSVNGLSVSFVLCNEDLQDTLGECEFKTLKILLRNSKLLSEQRMCSVPSFTLHCPCRSRLTAMRLKPGCVELCHFTPSWSLDIHPL